MGPGEGAAASAAASRTPRTRPIRRIGFNRSAVAEACVQDEPYRARLNFTQALLELVHAAGPELGGLVHETHCRLTEPGIRLQQGVHVFRVEDVMPFVKD